MNVLATGILKFVRTQTTFLVGNSSPEANSFKELYVSQEPRIEQDNQINEFIYSLERNASKSW